MLEGWKFGVYILIPITASMYFGNPERQKQAADYWGYVKYPPNPNTGMKEQIEALRKQKEQRQAYREQLKELNAQAKKSSASSSSSSSSEDKTTSSRGWFRWIGLGKGSSASPKEETS